MSEPVEIPTDETTDESWVDLPPCAKIERLRETIKVMGEELAGLCEYAELIFDGGYNHESRLEKLESDVARLRVLRMLERSGKRAARAEVDQ